MRTGGDFEKRITPNCVHFPTAVSATDFQKSRIDDLVVSPRIIQFPQTPVQGDQVTIKSTIRECSNLEQPVWFFRMGLKKLRKSRRQQTPFSTNDEILQATLELKIITSLQEKNSHHCQGAMLTHTARAHLHNILIQRVAVVTENSHELNSPPEQEPATALKETEMSLGKGSSCGMTFI